MNIRKIYESPDVIIQEINTESGIAASLGFGIEGEYRENDLYESGSDWEMTFE